MLDTFDVFLHLQTIAWLQILVTWYLVDYIIKVLFHVIYTNNTKLHKVTRNPWESEVHVTHIFTSPKLTKKSLIELTNFEPQCIFLNLLSCLELILLKEGLLRTTINCQFWHHRTIEKCYGLALVSLKRAASQLQ